jgi:hypothetical protein
MMNNQSKAPVAKVWAQAAGAGLGGALGTIAIWLLQANGVDVPEAVGAAFDTIFAVIIGFVAGYLTPPANAS